MLAHPITPPLRARRAQPLPIGKLVLGQPVQQAAETLPRLFNLCRVAQGVAARAAFGLPQEAGWEDELRQEILKEHVLKLCLKWPGQLSIPPLTLPRDWMQDADTLRAVLFGPAKRMPVTMDAFTAFLEGDVGIAPVLRAICQIFPRASATRAILKVSAPNTIFDGTVQENSVAGRHATHPVMRAVDMSYGRGPLWSATGVAYDVEACLENRLPRADLNSGRSVVPAARGLYGIRATVADSTLVKFERVTPTDHLVMPGGVLEQSLATLDPVGATARAPLLLSILDPCFPIALEQNQTQEMAHA